MPELQHLDEWIVVAAAATQLGLALAVLLQRRRSPLRLSFGILCISLFGWHTAALAHSLTGALALHYVDLALSPWTVVAALHFVLVFVGKRQRLRLPLVLATAGFGALSSCALLGTLVPALGAFARGLVWDMVFLALLALTTLWAGALLVRHVRASKDEERRIALRVLLAFTGGMLLGATELANNFVSTLPSLGAVGTLFATVVLLPVAMGDSPLSPLAGGWRVVWPAMGAAASLILYLAVFRFVATDTLALALGTTTLALVVGLCLGQLLQRLGDDRARRERWLWMGRMSEQLAHDLKNPLAALRGAVQLMEEEHRRGRSLDDQAHLLPLLAEQSARMIRVIDKYTRFGALELDTAPVALDGLVADAVVTTRGRSVERELIEDYGGVQDVTGDADLLGVAIENLLSNAVDASEPGQRIWVSTRVVDQGVELRVRDEGQGMDARTRERAFDEFFTTHAEGTGLGLAFVKRVVEAHAGEVHLRSRQGEGTEVRIRLGARGARVLV